MADSAASASAAPQLNEGAEETMEQTAATMPVVTERNEEGEGAAVSLARQIFADAERIRINDVDVMFLRASAYALVAENINYLNSPDVEHKSWTVTMDEWKSWLPEGYMEAMSGDSQSSPCVQHKENLGLRGNWKEHLKIALQTVFPNIPCVKTCNIKNQHLRKPTSRKQGSRVWYADIYCVPGDKDLLKLYSCCSIQVACWEFGKDDNFITLEAVLKGTVLSGSAGTSWHTQVRKGWASSKIPWLETHLEKHEPAYVYNLYCHHHQKNQTEYPRPGKINWLYKIKSKLKAVTYNAADEKEDLEKEMEKMGGEGTQIADGNRPNFYVGWCSQSQMKVLSDHSGGGTAYIDSTMGFINDVSKAGQDPKKVAYCSLVVKDIPGRHSVPVTEMMTTSQDAVTTSSWLQRIRQFWKSGWSGTGRLFRTVVSDDSWAFIHAVLQAFNQENVVSFLKRCFDAEENGTVDDETSAFRAHTVLHICAFHAIRRVRAYVSRNTKGKGKTEVIRLAVNAYRALLRTDCRQDAKKIVQLMATVFGRKKKSKRVDDAIKELQEIQKKHIDHMKKARNQLPSQPTEDEVSEDPDCVQTSNHPEPPVPQVPDKPTDAEEAWERQQEEDLAGVVGGAGEPLYKQSPYYFMCNAVIEEATKEAEDDYTGLNPYYMDKFLDYLLSRHLAYLPMLNRTFVKREVNPVTLLLTNNCVEKWFALVKKSVFPNGQKLRRAEVLRKLGIFVNGEIASREFPTYRGPRPNARKPNKNRRNKQSEASATAGVPPQAPGQGRRKRKANVTTESQTEFLQPITDTSVASDEWGGYTVQICPNYSTKFISEQPQTPSAASNSQAKSENLEPPIKKRRFAIDSQTVRVPDHILEGLRQQQQQGQEKHDETKQQLQQEEAWNTIPCPSNEVQEAMQSCQTVALESGHLMICEDKNYNLLLDNMDNLPQPVSIMSRFNPQLIHYTPPGVQDNLQPILLVSAGSEDHIQNAINQFLICQSRLDRQMLGKARAACTMRDLIVTHDFLYLLSTSSKQRSPKKNCEELLRLMCQ